MPAQDEIIKINEPIFAPVMPGRRAQRGLIKTERLDERGHISVTLSVTLNWPIRV